ncbi:unnamed protein product [Sphagnum jensenii]|uniref:SPX domain-containing protein n=1 Tax=Sphagnum jensenii TaxID=128206 RepID=A0ABP0WWV4_9BRYO
MPAEYRPMFLNYKLLKKHIFLNQISACQCSIKRQVQGLSEVVRHPALLGQPCHLCSRPVYSIERDHEFQSTVYDGDDDTAAILDLEFQCVAFTKLLESELFKINRFFTSSMQYYVDTMHDLDLMRREEESRQNILHPGGRSFWSLKKLMNIRRRMVTLSEKMTLLDIYSFLNHAAFEKILKKHDRITGSSIRRDYVHQIVERQDFFLCTPALNDQCGRCLSLLDRFPRPRRRQRGTHRGAAAARRHRARAVPLAGPALATGAGGSVGSDYDSSSVSESPYPSRNRRRVQPRTNVRAPQCVYTRAVQVATDAAVQVYTGVSSTHNCESLYPPNV